MPPRDLRELRAFLGTVGFYRRFILLFAVRARPLTEMTSPSREWCWGEKQQAAFEDLRNALTTDPVLALPSRDGRFRLYCDWSALGVSAILH